jgi:hypothetical protein
LLGKYKKEIQKSITDKGYVYNPVLNNTGLSDYEERLLEKDVLNTLYRDSRINPNSNTLTYHKFVEDRLRKKDDV